MPKNGEDIPLTVQLEDQETGKYVRAKVLNPSDLDISGSPVNMTHQSEGLYTATLTMPNVEYVRIQYQVFDDAGYSTPSDGYGWVGDVIERDETS